MEKQDYAKQLALEYGLRVFPLKPNTKTPLPSMTNFWDKATADESQIEEYWPEGSTNNIGICTTKNAHGNDLLIIDVDSGKGKKGKESFQQLINDGYELPKTFSQDSPNGKHYFLISPRETKNSTNRLGKDIDTRGHHGYVVGAGSEVGEKKYTISTASHLTWAPEWPLELLEANIPEGGHKEMSLTKEMKVIAKDSAIAYLGRVGAAVEGQGGDTKTYEVACGLKDYGIGTKEGAVLMLEHWHEGCGWTLDELEKKMIRAYKYGKEKPGVRLQTAIQKKLKADEKSSEIQFFEKMNEKYAISRMGDSGVWVLDRTDKKTGFHKRSDFLLLTENNNYVVRYMDGEQDKTAIRNAGKEWLKWKGRKEFKGIRFMPGQYGEDVDGYYNGWRGWAVKRQYEDFVTEAQKEGTEMFFKHIEEIICDKDPMAIRWVMSYIADIFQDPGKRPDTVLVLKGLQGTGKGTFVDVLGHLIGDAHYLQVQQMKDVIGEYNGLLHEKILVNLDEATFQGDKRMRDNLKGLTGGKLITYNVKRGPQFTGKNYTRYIITSNADRPIDTETNNRRYTVLNVNEEKAENVEYFERMTKLIFEEKASELILDRLLRYKYEKKTIMRNMKNDEMVRQKIASFNLVERMVFDSICVGKFQGIEGEFYQTWRSSEYLPWPSSILFCDLYQAYKNYAKENATKYETTTSKREFSVMFAKITGATRSQRWEGGVQSRTMEIPLMRHVKQNIDKLYGPIPWEEYITEGELCES